MSFSSFNINPRNLTPEQYRLVTMYINQYNQTNNHIDVLLDMLDEIRGNINNIVHSTQPRRTRINRHNRQYNTNTGLNRLLNHLFNDRQNSDRNVYYDYNNPINPEIYNEFNTFNNLYNRRNPLGNFDISYNNIYRNYNSNNTVNNIPQNNDLSNFLSNFLNSTVVVRPTNDQIQNASRIVRYGDIDNPLSQSCPISLDEFNDDDQIRQLLPCGHLFHQNQFQEWFENNVRCPVCRYDIRNYRPLSRRNTPTNIGSEQSNESQARNATQTPSTSTPTSPSISPTENTTENISTNRDNTNTPPVSNINVTRDPISNQIDQLTFDITNPDFTNNFLDQIARNIFQSMLNPRSQNINDRFMIDPSNNILFYETIIRPNSESNENINDDNN